MALADDIFGSGSPQDFRIPGLFQPDQYTSGRTIGWANQGELATRALARQRATDPLFQSLTDLLSGSVIGSRGILGSEFGRADAFSDLFRPQQQAEEDLAAVERSQLLRGQNQDTLGRILQLAQTGPTLTEDQAGRIRGAADLAIESGLSDLGRFREQTFEDVRQSAASRGLRPNDTPIVNRLTDLGEQLGRQAQGLTTDIRTQQLLQELQYPLAAFQANLGGLGVASDVGARERAFEQGLANQAQATRLGLASGAITGAGNLATSQNPATTFTQLRELPEAPEQQKGNPLAEWGPVLSAVAQGIGSYAASDERVKEDVEPLDAKAVLSHLRGVRYRYKDPEKHGEGDQIGILAQDLLEAGLGGAVAADDEGTLMVNTQKLALPTLGLLASLNERVNDLEARDA